MLFNELLHRKSKTIRKSVDGKPVKVASCPGEQD